MNIAHKVGAVSAFLLGEQIEGLLPLSFAFAAGAMLARVAFELGPSGFRSGHVRSALAGPLIGAGVRLARSALLGV